MPKEEQTDKDVIKQLRKDLIDLNAQLARALERADQAEENLLFETDKNKSVNKWAYEALAQNFRLETRIAIAESKLRVSRTANKRLLLNNNALRAWKKKKLGTLNRQYKGKLKKLKKRYRK